MRQLVGDDVSTILEYFEELEDPRSSINRKHLLGDLIVISVCGVIAGADGPNAIGVWAKSNREWLQNHLELPHGIPSHDTIGRLLAALKPAAFQTCFQNWVSSLCEHDDQDTSNETSQQQEVIAIDGKALRRSHDRKNELGALFLVSAWSVQYGVSLGQLATEEKSNEITAIPELIDNIDVAGAIITIDAAGCQRTIAAKIIDRGGDYILALKGNQGNLHKAVEDWILEQMENDFANVTVRKHEQTVRGHGRIDTLTYYQFNVPRTLPGRSNWKHLRTIGVAIRVRARCAWATADRIVMSMYPISPAVVRLSSMKVTDTPLPCSSSTIWIISSVLRPNLSSLVQKTSSPFAARVRSF